ncbi:MAG: hypothetical protein ACREJ5_14230, partial [Geminicoccaceae bacterium]
MAPLPRGDVADLRLEGPPRRLRDRRDLADRSDDECRPGEVLIFAVGVTRGVGWAAARPSARVGWAAVRPSARGWL